MGAMNMMVQIDGIKVQLEKPGKGREQHGTYSIYAHMHCAQSILAVGARNTIVSRTRWFGGGCSETRCVMADLDRLFGHLQYNDTVGSDKGFNLSEALAKRNIRFYKPTEKTFQGLPFNESLMGKIYSQVRAVTERAVLAFKEFNMFGGPPIHQGEWPHLDEYASIVSMCIALRGPFPDHLVPSDTAASTVAQAGAGDGAAAAATAASTVAQAGDGAAAAAGDGSAGTSPFRVNSTANPRLSAIPRSASRSHPQLIPPSSSYSCSTFSAISAASLAISIDFRFRLAPFTPVPAS